MYNHIAVAVDGSETAYLALREAIKLAKEQKSKLCLILVADEMLPVIGEYAVIDFDHYQESIKKNSRDILADMLKVAKESDIDAESHLVEMMDYRERLPEKIVEDAKKWGANLLVIGTHGRRGFNHFLLGSVAEAVIRIATIPILLIRAQESKK